MLGNHDKACKNLKSSQHVDFHPFLSENKHVFDFLSAKTKKGLGFNTASGLKTQHVRFEDLRTSCKKKRDLETNDIARQM